MVTGRPYLACWDTETTGIDVENDRIVTSYFALLDREGEVVYSREWLINPGVLIPEEATKVHGVTDEMVQDRGENPKDAIQDIRYEIELHIEDLPLVAFNIPYDLTILNRECRRWGLATLPEIPMVLDGLVVDKGIDMYRKGSRKLVDVAEHYGVREPKGGAHSADYDAVLAGRLAIKLRPLVRELCPEGQDFWPWLMGKQREWKAEQAASLQKYLRSAKNKNGADPEAIVDPSWPMVPFSGSIEPRANTK